MFLGGVFAQLRVFSRTALCNSVETYVAYIFHLARFQMDLGFFPGNICLYFNLIQRIQDGSPQRRFATGRFTTVLDGSPQLWTVHHSTAEDGSPLNLWSRKFQHKGENMYYNMIKKLII